MTSLDREIVRRKLERIATDLRLLEPVAALDLERYREDPYRPKATERLLQEIVEAAVDVNTHLLIAAGRPAPDDLYSSFLDLADLGVLARPLAETLAPSAGLRNRLVHEYDRIDDARVLEAAGEAVAHYPRYVAAVERHVAACG